MRIIVERWYLGPIVAALALFGCFVSSLGTAAARSADVSQATLERVYALAREGQYDAILREGLASPESVDYLRMQDACFGRLTSWKVADVGGGSFGVPWTTVITVERPAITVVDSATGTDPHSVRLGLNSSENDLPDRIAGDPQAWINPYIESTPTITYPTESPIDLPDQATAVAKAILHQLDSSDLIQSQLGVIKKGDYWVVTEKVRTSDGIETRYLVLSRAGAAIERVGDSRY